MSVKLSSYLWLRNNYLLPFTKGEHDTGRYLSQEKRDELKQAIEEIDELHKGRDAGVSDSPIIGEHVLISGYTEVIERSYDPEHSARLFQEIHHILKDSFVDVRVYRDLGGAFRELGLEPQDEELKVIIDYATGEFNRGVNDFRAERTMCARVIIGRFKEGKLGKER